MTSAGAADKVDVKAFWRDGYQIVRGVYTPEEIRRFREDVMATRSHRGDLLSNPRLSRVITDGNIVGIARTLLGKDEIVYAGDSSVTVNSSQRGYHKDNADREDLNAPDWQGRYTVLRFGIYCQDHVQHTGGLNLRARSHNTTSLSKGRTVYVRSGVGDVVVWSLRTSHSGNGSLLRFPKWLHPHPGVGRRLPSVFEAAKDGDRMALFVALGLDDAHHDRYTEYLKTRRYICGMWRHSQYDEDTLARAASIGLKVRDLPKEIADDSNVGQNEVWQPLPY
ncbi:hypothetical protein ACOCJ4_13520 [Knoellia sp. CPCC 206435]|uniref:hypothetical protein n=1 Tax=Knoellia terrae TaxID=3404797 RepID=UPI003B42ED47